MSTPSFPANGDFVLSTSGRAGGSSETTIRSSGLDHEGAVLLGGAIQMAARLRDHIERLDQGVVHAVDDVAVVLRALLCDNNKGNRVLSRLYNTTKFPRPSIRLSAPPDSGADVLFSVGSIPIDEPGARDDGAVEIPVAKWPHIPVLTIKTQTRIEKLTWNAFLNGYANKWGGAHLVTGVPQTLQRIDLHAAVRGVPGRRGRRPHHHGANHRQQLLDHAARTNGDPLDARTRSQLLRERYDQDGGLPWPPQRNQRCWCGSNRKYKKCCGAAE